MWSLVFALQEHIIGPPRKRGIFSWLLELPVSRGEGAAGDAVKELRRLQGKADLASFTAEIQVVC